MALRTGDVETEDNGVIGHSVKATAVDEEGRVSCDGDQPDTMSQDLVLEDGGVVHDEDLLDGHSRDLIRPFNQQSENNQELVLPLREVLFE